MADQRIQNKGPAQVLAVCTLMAGASFASAQEIEPRAYSNAPLGVNFLIIGYAYTEGGLAFDPALPVSAPKLSTSGPVAAFARSITLFGKSAKFDVVVPAASLSGSALLAGEPIERNVDGLIDTKFRVSVNLLGAPALSLKEFAGYKPDLVVGVSLQVSAPTGQYDNTRVVNLGGNRWWFKPELGISKTRGPWTLEGKAAVTLYTDNDDFFGGQTRAQDPLYSLQGHAIYNFRKGVWGSLDATYFTGGRTTVDGGLNNDLQQNWRMGGTLAIPVNTHNSIKLYASSGVSARTGNNFDLIGLAWQHRWGGGL
ncbi:MAG TPA: transporter [Arenimonas sp.]|nr:transporter [Arenimonas sp.]